MVDFPEDAHSSLLIICWDRCKAFVLENFVLQDKEG